MGCCLTTTAAAEDDSKTNSKPRDAPPPPPGSVEETVKEVLSETPVTYKTPPPNSTPTKTTSNSIEEEFTSKNAVVQVTSNSIEEQFRSKNVVVQVTKNSIEENASDISSEIYSYSASYSAATTTTIGTGIEIEIEEDGEVNQKVNKPSPAKMATRRQEAISSGERSRRKERGIRPPPPARRSVVRSTDKKPHLPSRNLTAEQRHRNVVPSTLVRREPPARRSRSPAMRGEGLQHRQVKDKTPVKKSGNRVPVKVTENEVNVKVKKTNDDGVMPVPVPEPEQDTNESLENPLVSLECFIFL